MIASELKFRCLALNVPVASDRVCAVSESVPENANPFNFSLTVLAKFGVDVPWKSLWDLLNCAQKASTREKPTGQFHDHGIPVEHFVGCYAPKDKKQPTGFLELFVCYSNETFETVSGATRIPVRVDVKYYGKYTETDYRFCFVLAPSLSEARFLQSAKPRKMLRCRSVSRTKFLLCGTRSRRWKRNNTFWYTVLVSVIWQYLAGVLS